MIVEITKEDATLAAYLIERTRKTWYCTEIEYQRRMNIVNKLESAKHQSFASSRIYTEEET